MRSFPLVAAARVEFSAIARRARLLLPSTPSSTSAAEWSCAFIVPSASARPPSRRAWQACAKGRDGLHRRRRDRGQRPAGSRLHRFLTRDQHRGGLYGSGPRCADRLRRPHHHARAYRELSLCCVVHPVAKRFPATSFISTRGCWNVRRTCVRNSVAAPSPRCPSSKPKRRTFPLYSNQLDFHHGWADYLSPSLFELGMLPAVDVGKIRFARWRLSATRGYRVVAGDLKLAYAQLRT